MTTIEVDLSDQVFERGVPTGTLAWLRANAPVWRWESAGSWVVTTHELVTGMNRNPEVYSSAGGIVPPGSTVKQEVLLPMDPPVHTEYRRMVNMSFMPRVINALRPTIEALAAEAVGDLCRQGGGDVITALAAAFPFRVMSHLTATPRWAEPQVIRWGNAISPNSDPEYRPTPDTVTEAFEAIGAFLSAQFEDRRRDPGSDLFSELVAIRRNGEPLPEGQMRSFGINYLLGGTETTRTLIAQGLLALLEHREQLARFTEGEVDAPTMVEELLRYVTPVAHHSRWATRDHEVAGQTIRAGDRVTLWMISANRDESVFSDPEELDIGRTPNPHCALGGGGPHFCLGAHLARLETAVVFETLKDVLDRIELVAPPERIRTNFFNGLKHLYVRVG